MATRPSSCCYLQESSSPLSAIGYRLILRPIGGEGIDRNGTIEYQVYFARQSKEAPDEARPGHIIGQVDIMVPYSGGQWTKEGPIRLDWD